MHIDVKLTYILIFLFIISNPIFAQDTVYITKDVNWINGDEKVYESDTVVFSTPMRRHILVGTTILRSSSKNEQARGYGYFLRSLKSTDCSKENPGEKPKRIQEVSSVIKTDSLWKVNLQITANCCYSFLGEIEVVNDTIMNLVYHGYGTYCFCTCCFGLEYEMRRESFINSNDIEYFMINGDRKTLKRIE